MCKSLIAPECEFSYLSSSTYLGTIPFSEPVIFGNITSSDITITIDGPLAPYSFDYTIDETTGFIEGETSDKFRIQFSFLSTLAGKEKGKLVCLIKIETITIKFNNPDIVHDLDGNPLMTEKLEKKIPFSYVVLLESEKAAASSQSNGSLFAMLLAFGTSTFISVALGGTVEATWLLFGCIQMMSFVPLFNLNLPANFREFTKNLSVLHGEPQAIPNLFEHYVDTTGLEPFNEYFYLMSKHQ